MSEPSAAYAGAAWRVSLAYAALFLALGASLPYLPVWLASRGLTGEQVGLVIAAGMVARFLAAPAVGFAADAVGRSRRVLVIAAAVLTGAYALYVPAAGVWALAAVTVLAASAHGPMVPVLDSVAIRAARATGFSYGRVRSAGSVAFIVANVAVGVLIARYGPGSILVWLVAAAGLGVFAMARLPEPSAGRRPERPSGVLKALARPDIVAALATSALVQGSHAFYYGFSALVWRDAGLSGTVIGLLWAWGVAAEIVFLAAFGRRAEKLGPAALLGLGAAAGLVRWTALAFEPGLAGLALLQTLHAGTFAMAHLGLIAFVAGRVPPHAAATAQALNSALTLGGVLAGATALSGVLYDLAGAKGYLAMTALAGAGLAAAAVLAALSRKNSK